MPWAPLLAMALTGFVIIMTETLPAGLLPQIAGGLAVSEAAAGQLVSAYAAGTVLAAVPAVAMTRTRGRKPLMLVGITGFLIANAATAVNRDYGLALAIRFVAGGFSGLLWGLIPGYARRIVPPALAGRGLAVAMVGTPVALSVGTPLGSFGGSVVGWRWTFAALSLVAVVLGGWVLLGVPDAPGQDASTRTPLRGVVLTPGVLPVLAVVLGWMLAHNILYTYLAPYLSAVGVPGRVDSILLVFGLSSLAGIWVTALLVDRALRLLLLASLAGFALAAIALAIAGTVPAVFYAAVVVWGATFGGASTQLNTASADASGEDVDVTAALVSTTWNLAILGGGVFGGLLLAAAGAAFFPLALLVLVVPALLVAVVARHHAFPLTRRPQDPSTSTPDATRGPR